jgi:uncharacterized membrane protein YcaP (DUF421 family)
MFELIGGAGELGWVALKTLLLYLTAVIGFRLGERRALAEMSPFDFVAAVAVGAIVGRVPNSDTTSYVAGATTLVTLLIAHKIVTRLRFFPSIADIVDHKPRLLVANGKVLHAELGRCGLTPDDLYGLLRRQGVDDLSEARFVIFERRGEISIIRHGARGDERGLVRDIIEQMSSKP